MNKLNTFKWYKDHTYTLDTSHDVTDQQAAFAKALEADMYPTGTFYQNTTKPVFWEQSAAYQGSKTPLFRRELNMDKLKKLIDSKRTR